MKLQTDDTKPGSVPVTSPMPEAGLIPSRWQFRGLTIFAAVLSLLYAWPLLKLVVYAAHAELYSHILLIPFISGYLLWIKKTELRVPSQSSLAPAVLSAIAGGLVLAAYWLALKHGWEPEKPDYLAPLTLSYLLFLLAGAFIFLGAKYLRNITFPTAFLFLCVPFPLAVRSVIETFLQHGSADVAYPMFVLSGMPVLKTDTIFQLPGFPLEVAPECSGIHSTLILFITCLLACYLFLRKPSSRWILMLAVIPLALLRNGFRIFVIGQLCVRIGPQMMDSAIHRHGGPLFFLLSLVPLYFLLIYLVKRESRKKQATLGSPKE